LLLIVVFLYNAFPKHGVEIHMGALSKVLEAVNYVRSCGWGEIASGHLEGYKFSQAFFKEKCEGMATSVQAALTAVMLSREVEKLGAPTKYMAYGIAGMCLVQRIMTVEGKARAVCQVNALGMAVLVLSRFREQPRQAIAFLATVVYEKVATQDEPHPIRKAVQFLANKPYACTSLALRIYALSGALRITTLLSDVVWPRICAVYHSVRPSFTIANMRTAVDALNAF
jgi:hypothetical protein